MADSAGILAQSSPLATTLTDIYTVPAGKLYAVISTITVCNRSSSPTTFRISVAKAGIADDVKQYIVYDSEIPENAALPWTLGITLALSDVLRVYVNDATVSFNVFGVEVS
jgi:hypothetical protein